MALISVIVPVYKVEKYLHRCINSILKQTFSDFDLILVDDGSPDDSGKICDEYAQNENRVHVIHQDNQGVAVARNTGLEWVYANSNSEWISFIDSDDWVSPNYLAFLLEAIRKTNTKISICAFNMSEGVNTLVDTSEFDVRTWETKEYFKKHNLNAVVPWGKLYAKECFRYIRYPEGKIHEDEFTTYKCLFQYKYIAVVNPPLYSYYTNMEGIMNSVWTPKRLVAIDAYAERVEWFKEHKMLDMYQWALNEYVWGTVVRRERIIKEQNRCIVDTYVPILDQILRNILKRYKKDLPISSYTAIYELVFPKRMKVYWYWKAISIKMKKIINLR